MKDFKNNLMKRREVVIELESPSNPGYQAAKEAISSKFKVDESCVLIKKVEGSFGSNKFTIDAFIYDSVENRQSAEPKKKGKEKK